VGSGIQAFLLGMLEPETARRHVDVFLKTECDFSAVMWVATANELSPISAPLLSRLRVLLLRQPGREHFGVIAANVLAEIAGRWGLERAILPSLEALDLPWSGLQCARQVRVATEAAVVAWAKGIQRH
jgi:hypothetical protein